jgi:hypothetical protein
VRGAIPLIVVAGTGGVGRGPIPSLKTAFEAHPAKPHSLRWVFCCHSTAEEGLRCARSILARGWDAEIARVELASESLLDIETGRKDWDAVLAFSQQTAIQSLIGGTRSLPYPSPVVGRNPERGFSLRCDGSDYAAAWCGADLTDVLSILPVWSLAQPQLARGLLRNYCAFAGEGLPDARPGAGGQHSGLLAPPLLAQAVWRTLGGREDAPFLEALWPTVERTLEAWFAADHDRDGDGAPEWERPDSFGAQVPPLMAREDPWGGWIPPDETESPALAALALGECHAAARMAECVGKDDRAREWRKRSEDVRRALDRMASADGYRTIDRVTHNSPTGKVLVEIRSGGEAGKQTILKEPARLLVRCTGSQETRPVIQVVVRGRNAEGMECEEVFRSEHFNWLRGAGTCFSRTVWKQVDSLRAEGPAAGMVFRLEVPNLQREDLSHYLPLWSRAVPPPRAERLFARLDSDSAFGSPAGLRFVPSTDPAAGKEPSGGIWMFWNMLLGEAALRYGKDALALAWIEAWMRALAEALRTDRSFRSCYDPDRPGGWGPRNSLQGIFPVGLFLAALGVHPVDSKRVWAGGRSIFPFPVTVRWRGMTVRREGDSLRVEFPSGGTREFRGTERTLITDEA